jgi:DNA-binding response OmpR family regulator
MREHSTTQIGKLVVNLGTRAVTVGGKPVHLTDKEYGILNYSTCAALRLERT